MPFEFYILVGAVILGFVQLFAATHLKTKIRGVEWNIGPRDEVKPPLPGVAGRLERASHNFAETFPFFVAVVLMVVVAGKHSALTEAGSVLYLGARLLYVFAYAAAIRGVRTALWLLSIIGIVMMMIALFV